MNEVRMGIVGIGGMGGNHAGHLVKGEVPRARLTAVADVDAEALSAWKDKDGINTYDTAEAMIRSGDIDAVIIATPHYDHTSIGIDALGQGLHTLVEKPISVHKADCQRLIDAHTDPDIIFCAMFNQRVAPVYAKVKDLLAKGTLGEITRVNWIITDWFRTKTYYESGGWRATWEGEGGGVLMNQYPHQLDLIQWFCGMPSRVTAFCSLGKRRDIEVEDEVTGYLEYPNGATGVFITCVTEAPGTNRLEICGEMGELVVEKDRIHFTRNEVGMTEFALTTDSRFGTPPVWEIDVPAVGRGEGHLGIIKNFVEAILDGTPLIAPAEEGIHGVELGNAMLYSGLTGKTIDMPLDGEAYEAFLKDLIAKSTYVKETKDVKKDDLDGSY